VPKCVSDLGAFFGLASYYRMFVQNFASIAEPLSALTKKGVCFSWSPEAQQASYYRKFVQNFASIAEPLSALTKKGVCFSWSPEAPSSTSSEPSQKRSPWITHSQTKLSFWTPMRRMSRWAQYSPPRWTE